MNDPYSTHRPHLDPAVWAEYEARNKAARRAYREAQAVAGAPVRTCECGTELGPRRKRCDDCVKAARIAYDRARYQARKAAAA